MSKQAKETERKSELVSQRESETAKDTERNRMSEPSEQVNEPKREKEQARETERNKASE